MPGKALKFNAELAERTQNHAEGGVGMLGMFDAELAEHTQNHAEGGVGMLGMSDAELEEHTQNYAEVCRKVLLMVLSAFRVRTPGLLLFLKISA